MNFRAFSSQIIIRVGLLALSISAAILLALNTTLWFTAACTALLALVQLVELIWFSNQIQRELTRFFKAIQYQDYNTRFNHPKLEQRFGELSSAYQMINEQLRESKIEKEAQLTLFRTLMEKLQIGMIAFHPKKGNVAFMNQAASELLQIPPQKFWKDIERQASWFTEVVASIPFGGRKLASIERGIAKKEYSIDVGYVMVNQKNYTMVSFSGYQKMKLSRKKIEAWHKLIRILTHEIMNSITPVSSLSETMMSILHAENEEIISPDTLDQDTLEDLYLATKTINKRSNGMLTFVSDYRKLTRIPAPNFEIIAVADLLDDVTRLMKPELEKRHIDLHIAKNSHYLQIKCDKTLIEQVIINLFSNSFHALKKTDSPKIKISAEATEKQIALHFSDNGSGIEPDKKERIFIPFYSTKEHGSGIGLALSKNIMQVHQGNLTVQSIPDKETVFSLIFVNHSYQEVEH